MLLTDASPRFCREMNYGDDKSEWTRSSAACLTGTVGLMHQNICRVQEGRGTFGPCPHCMED